MKYEGQGFIKTISKQMFLYKWPFFAICVFIFHKSEVLTVILRCLMSLNLDQVKSYGLKCSLRPHSSSVNSKKVAIDNDK